VQIEAGGEVGGAAPGSPPPNARRRARRPTCAPPIPAALRLPTRRVHGVAIGICVRRRKKQRAWGALWFSKFRRLRTLRTCLASAGIIVEIAGGAFLAGAVSG